MDIIEELYGVIQSRRENNQDSGSYTAYLFEQGEDKILKKIGEEAAEVIIAAKNGSGKALTGEVADLVYHLLVLMAWHGIAPSDVRGELSARRNKKKNPPL
ncbi:phosphoribosyl-ATP diphosphatase [Pelotomaculum propionicicum]|uniref:Phosphoribosyl-ATP pyrophosphatase n=1 Tax=Pelotomaculum propionicicum TaxID=258475 RepID=A0A4Y7RPH2_9FIRM|nr:phosphoribosyl-ATP diphosphatase [Pelotomaculum propionicicum]NLI14309.1 phosphoribosyl-ATP diphosphatase [Peptococcaceae bacterium]TEB10885.1 Phosphoribosyl-ATP pyrophosphatase [Pelotomaculum propionicicum]